MRLFFFEVVEVEVALIDEALGGAGKERPGAEGEKGDSGFSGLGVEAVPERAGDLPFLTEGEAVKVQKEVGEVPITQEKISALEGLV